MEKVVFLALVLVLNMSLVQSSHGYWKTGPYEPVKLVKTHLHFYMHDILSGPDPTAVIFARPNTSQELVPFGTAFAIDDPLTEGPEMTSKVIGNGRGMYLTASRGQDMTLVMYIDLGFTSGKFNGSSLSVFSRNPILETNREMAIVGGRGKFKFAQGFIKVTTRSLNFTTGDALLEYHVEVIHHE